MSGSQNPQRACSSPRAMADTPWSQSDEGSSSEDQGLRIGQDPADHVSLLRRALYKKMVDLVLFLLHKYQVKEPTTEEEMLNSVIQDYQDYFLVIFNEASEYLQLIFGIEVKEVDPTSHSYVLVTILGLTYDGMLSDNQTMPKTGLLAIILGVIFMEGNPTPEEEIWEALNMMGIYTGREHFIFGEPRKLLTEEWVQENYLEYRQVPGSDPARYEFLWGPRAHAETSKMKVLEYVSKVNGSDPRSFPSRYEEALRDEEERAQVRIEPRARRRTRGQSRFQDPI